MNEDVHSDDNDISDEDSMDWLEAVAKKHTGLNAKGSNGRTVLTRAVMRNDVNAVKALLLKGADPEAVDNNKKTALMYALESDNKEIIALLKNAVNR